MALGQEGSPGGSLEDLADTVVGSCGALQVLVGTDLLPNLLTLLEKLATVVDAPGTRSTYLLRGDGLLRSLVQLFDGLGVETKILLATDQDDGETLAEVEDLGDPLMERLA